MFHFNRNNTVKCRTLAITYFFQMKSQKSKICIGFQQSSQKNFARHNCLCSSTTLHKNLISIFCGLGEKRTRFRNKKGKKENKGKKKEKQRNKPYHGQKLVGWDEGVL